MVQIIASLTEVFGGEGALHVSKLASVRKGDDVPLCQNENYEYPTTYPNTYVVVSHEGVHRKAEEKSIVMVRLTQTSRVCLSLPPLWPPASVR